MPCKLTFSLTSGKVDTKIQWSKNKKEVRAFKKFLVSLQEGEFNEKIIKAIVKFTKESQDIKTGKDIVRALKTENIMNSPIIMPDELGQEEMGYGTQE